MAVTPSRKLAVILHADVVGSTDLVRLNETVAHERMQDTFRRLSETIESYGGIAHELRGDALVAEFGRASDALCAALAFQKASIDSNASLKDEIKPRLRIGIAMGEVIIADHTITGEGVVLAQRLEQIAEPDGVCIQGAAYETVPKRLPFKYRSLGEKSMKGFDQAVRIYAVSLSAENSVPAPEPGVYSASIPGSDDSVSPLPARPAIAVLPFTNMSEDPEQEYFSDGITEDIITGLSYWRWFPVIARNSTFAYKGKATDVTRIGKALGAKYVVEGSVRRAGDRVRVSAQLIDATTGHHLWAQRYDGKLTDVFAIQDEMAEHIVTSIEPQLTQAEQSRSLRKHPKNHDAWDLTLRALARLTKMTKKGSAEASTLLAKAIESDPRSSYALSLLSLNQYHGAIFGWSDDRAESVTASHETAKQAVAKDANDWLASAMLGLTYLWAKREHELAVAEVERSVQLNPSAALAYHFLACVLEFSGRSADAIPHLHTIRRLDPHYRFESVALADLALSHLSLEQFEQSVDYAKQAIRVMPSNVRAYQRLASGLGHLGKKDEAKAAVAKILELQPGISMAALTETYPFKHREQSALFQDGLRLAGFKD